MQKNLVSLAVTGTLSPNVQDPNDKTTQGAPIKAVKTPASERTVQQNDAITAADLAVYFPDKAQQDAIEEYFGIALNQEYSVETTRDLMDRQAKIIWPNGRPTYNQARVVLAFYKARAQYPYRCMVKTIKSFPAMGATVNKKTGKIKLGKMPAKDGGVKSGKRTVSVGQWQSNVAKTIKATRERLTKARKVIDPTALKMYVEAIKALESALKADRKAS